MNKYYMFIFSLMISQFVCGMDMSVLVNNDLRKADRLVKIYAMHLVKHFYSLIPQDVSYVYCSGIMYEVSELNKIVYSLNSNTLAFRYNEKEVTCRLSYTGLNLSKKDCNNAFNRDIALVEGAYFQLLTK